MSLTGSPGLTEYRVDEILVSAKPGSKMSRTAGTPRSSPELAAF